MCQLNQPKNVSNEELNKIRAAIIHRGMWMGLILKEAKDRGLDWETIGREAIKKTGYIHGDGIKDRMDVEDSLVSFGNTFFTQNIKDIFEIEVKTITEEALELEYGHCPLLTAWQSLGFEGEFLEKLCDIAMCGDRGIESRFDNFEFKLGRTLAEGHKVCEVSFYRK
ncbi:MAG: L-2-amino-thiazoline-4-carboxylic acid hydrolase [Clostridia bacterium]|nr:L-2-amino-thiazoline-4-carboxylic acid hydrolase [Clostridia bacterium]